MIEYSESAVEIRENYRMQNNGSVIVDGRTKTGTRAVFVGLLNCATESKRNQRRDMDAVVGWQRGYLDHGVLADRTIELQST